MYSQDYKERYYGLTRKERRRALRQLNKNQGSFKAHLGMSMLYILLAVGGASLMGGMAYKVYQAGKEAGIQEVVDEFQDAQKAIREAQEQLRIDRAADYEKRLQESHMETVGYIEELANLDKVNTNLRKALEKPPEVIVKYQECAYRDEDHSSIINLYKELE